MIQPMRVMEDKMGVVIYTQNLRVEGTLHLRPASRLTDFLNLPGAGNFMAVTDAAVYSWSGEKPLHTASVMDINKNYINMVIPKPPPAGE